MSFTEKTVTAVSGRFVDVGGTPKDGLVHWSPSWPIFGFVKDPK